MNHYYNVVFLWTYLKLVDVECIVEAKLQTNGIEHKHGYSFQEHDDAKGYFEILIKSDKKEGDLAKQLEHLLLQHGITCEIQEIPFTQYNDA